MADNITTEANNTTATPAASVPSVASDRLAEEVQTFSADYVRELRQEAAKYRTKAGDAEKTAAKTLEKANARLIAAEIRALPGYDTALLERLIDVSGIQVADDGTVTGVKEAAEKAAKQFAAVKKQQSGEQWAPRNPAAGQGGADKYADINKALRG